MEYSNGLFVKLFLLSTLAQLLLIILGYPIFVIEDIAIAIIIDI
jgi:hypothetical protein|tara:strand:+ start:2444 stop:2575 length:132 start_codon:yes stop_codon:yes gene_type:complete